MPLRYCKFRSDDYFGYDVVYINYCLQAERKLCTDDIYDYRGGDCCGPKENVFCAYITEYQPSLGLFKYLVQGKIRIKCGSMVIDILNASTQRERTDLVKYTAMCYFREFGNIDILLAQSNNHMRSELSEWFADMRFSFGRSVFHQIMFPDVDDVKTVLKYTNYTPEELLSYASCLEMPAISYLADLCNDINPEIFINLIREWNLAKIELLIRKGFRITKDVLAFARTHGYYNELLEIISEN